ncbi:hypothetical protein GCM10028819_24950 [Spirosoma humi]
MRVLSVMLLLCIAAILFFVFFDKPPLSITFQVVHISSDTTFRNSVWDVSDEYGRNISLRAIGEIDDSTEIFLKDDNHSDQFLKVQLPRGKFDTTWTGDYYNKQANVVFRHKKATKGSLKIIFRYLTPDGDTLVDG